MADQQSSHASLSSAVNIFYEEDILADFPTKTVYYSEAPIKGDIPKHGGQTIEFTRYVRPGALVSDVTDEFTATQLYMTASTISRKVRDVAGYIKLSKKADLTMIGGALDQAAKAIKQTAAESVDKVIRNEIGLMVADVAATSSLNYSNMAIDGGTLNSTGITARVWSRDKASTIGESDRFPVYHNKTRLAQSATVVSFAKTAMTVKTIQHGVSVLNNSDVPAMGDGMYRMIVHPEVGYQITTQAGFKGWFSPTTADPVKNNPAEVGTIAGVKIMNTTLAPKFALSGDTLSTSSGSLYASLLFGDEAYAVTPIKGEGGEKGFNFYLKESGAQTVSDPTNRIKIAGFDFLMAATITNKSAGIQLLSTSVY